MSVQFSYRISKTPDLEKLINQQVEKLTRYLRVFRPELVQLKGAIEENAARAGMTVSLNLRLPSGQMASQESSPSAAGAIKSAFSSITEQVKKHTELLRHQHAWPRRRSTRREKLETVPFEATVAAVKPEAITAADISGYIDVNLPRLKRFIEREIDYREDQDQLQPGQVTVDDVLGEAIARALSEQHDIPERMKLEPWMHRLAVLAIGELAHENAGEDHIPLERPRGEQNVHASDEARLQFHQPDEKLFEEGVIADPSASNPEELAARDEIIGMLETALQDAGRNESEAFILYTVEGFSIEETADITNRSQEEVRASIRKAREHLQRALPIKDPLKEKLVEYSKSA